MRTVPLSNNFALVSLLGLIIFAVLLEAQKIDKTWGFTMVVFFTICFIASIVSITPEFPEEYKGKNRKGKKDYERKSLY
ncbi:MAG: hypothetical protein Q8O89_04735 [Nanoarchaeota archaeon]|nr:hypothetical protein [Nanoarchaeota archaeon]